MKEIMKRIIVIGILSLLIGISVGAAAITVGSVTAKCGSSVTVPVTLTDNTGIAGAIVRIDYDKNLVFTAASAGDALGSLIFTPPALCSSNPATLLWDGLDADKSAGVMAYLTFTAPSNPGIYTIEAVCRRGDVFDGDLEDVEVVTVSGSITATDDTQAVAVTSLAAERSDNGITAEITSRSDIDACVMLALYDAEGRLCDLYTEECTLSSGTNTVTYTYSGKRKCASVKCFVWQDMARMVPLCGSRFARFNEIG